MQVYGPGLETKYERDPEEKPIAHSAKPWKLRGLSRNYAIKPY